MHMYDYAIKMCKPKNVQTSNEYYKVKDIIFKNVSVIFKGGT